MITNDILEEKTKEELIERVKFVQNEYFELNREKDKEIERLTNIVNKVEDMLQSPWNIDCVNQNNEFLNKLKELKEGKE